MNLQYVIPILSIQDKLSYIDSNKKFLELKKFCTNNIAIGFFHRFEFELENQWYPVLITNNKWLAQKVMKKFN